MKRGLLLALTLHVAVASGATPAARAQATSKARGAAGTPALQVDPRLMAEAAEAWKLIASPANPIWPGWDATDTPLLFYLTGRQDVLINHPRPPEGFVAYRGPLTFPGGRIMVRDGATILNWDGQNTSREIEGVQTLVVADALSNLRQRVRGLLQSGRPPADAARELEFDALATDPYEQIALIVHEAFHVFQTRMAPTKSANEMLLSTYPVLSVENNVGFALEGDALAAALTATSNSAMRAAAIRWLAVRRDRRSALSQQAVSYENGAEFGEGLAKYTEYRLLGALQGRTPGAQMWWVQGFRGYGAAALAPRRAALVDVMRRHMRGEVAVNNDPYGTAPLRMRLYYSGMAIGALLDRLSVDWKKRIADPAVSLTDLVEQALGASPEQLLVASRQARAGDHGALMAAKEQLARLGRARIDSLLGDIEQGEGTAITVDYGALNPPRAGLAFSPFGIVAVDSTRTIYTQVPIAARFPDGSQVTQTEPRPLLHDRARRLIRFRLRERIAAEAIGRAIAVDSATAGTARQLRFELPGLTVDVPNAIVQSNGGDLVIVLKPRD